MIVFNTGGFFFVYFQLQNYFKEIAFNKINDFLPIEELELIKVCTKSRDFTNDNVYERVNDREFKYYGKMYDIFQENFSNDTLYLYCVNDEKEDIINNAFAVYINSKKSESNNKSPIANIIKLFITIAIAPNNTSFSLSNTYHTNSNIYKVFYQNIIVDVPSPPPRFSS